MIFGVKYSIIFKDIKFTIAKNKRIYMKKYYKKAILIKILAILCSIMLLWSSPYAYHLEVSSIDTVHATEAIVAEGAAAVVEWLVAAFATIGLSEVAYENREALANSYWEYLKS